MRKNSKREKVWKYILKNRLATPKEVAKACKVSYGYALKLINDSGTPKEVIIQESKPPVRCQLLSEASSLTATDRNKDYGDAVDNHEHIARIYNAITGQRLTARDITLVHQATKLETADKPVEERSLCGQYGVRWYRVRMCYEGEG